MFWGLIMDANKRYTQTVEKAFHVSMASLDTTVTGNENVQVKLFYEGLSYLLCTLHKNSVFQVPLDLNFQEGTEISFTSNGKVHLTGYLIPEDGLDMDEVEEEEEGEEAEDDEVPQLVGKQSKRKAQDSPEGIKKVKQLKSSALKEEIESSDDDEDDLENDDDQDESLEIDGEAEDDSDDDDDDDDEEEEDDSEDEEEVEVKPQQKKQKQKEQQQANKKQKLVNGKDAKPEPTKQEKKKAKAEQAQQQQQQQKKAKGEQQQQQQNNAQQPQKKRVIEGGVQIEDMKVGNGQNAKNGKFVSVYYIGRLTNGKKFDSTTQGEGFKFRLGKGEVIKGWDVGIAGMKIGGKRRITIPPGMAYGAKGSPPVIPGNSTLVFEVELKNVH